MLEPYATREKLKFELINAGFKMYRRCDEQARDILEEVRASGTLHLKGDEKKDSHRSKLVEQIIELIATEYVPEKTSWKVALLNEISSCVRKEEETPAVFSQRFKSLTAKYSVQIGHIDHNASCRMALMMLQNAKLPTSIQSNMVIQLSGKTKINNNRMKSYVLNKKLVDSFIEYTEDFNKDLDPEERIFQHELLGKLKTISTSEDSEEGFTLRDMFEVMEQITEPIDVPKQISLLRKRNREGDRGQAKCHGCGEIGHNARDNPSRFRKMKKKNQEYRQRKASESQNRTSVETKNPEKTKTEYEPETDEDSDDDHQAETDKKPMEKRHKNKSFFRQRDCQSGTAPKHI